MFENYDSFQALIYVCPDLKKYKNSSHFRVIFDYIFRKKTFAFVLLSVVIKVSAVMPSVSFKLYQELRAYLSCCESQSSKYIIVG